MQFDVLSLADRKSVQECLGYLNFSAGAADPRFLQNLNSLFAVAESSASELPAWQTVAEWLGGGLAQLRGSSDAFRQVEQAEAALQLVFAQALPGYLAFHRDLLAHQDEATLFRPFFIGRMCEAVLQQGPPWQETDRIVAGAVTRINDYIGYRPVAVLHSDQKLQPYTHEFVRPVPLFVRDAGVAVGRYRALIEKAFEILQAAPADILFQAFFDLDLLDELALDPRAYDFDHPNHRRPNHVFGQWDLGHLDLSGRCRRFVVQQVTLEAMLQWIERRGDLPYEEVLYESAAVLAGTMLMGSGVSGNRPDCHDSTTTLASLVQRIAAYRDAFYDRLLARLEGRHAARLREEAALLQQPFGGARQHFNQRLAQRRAEQLQHVNLAYLYARMGHAEAAAREVRVVPVPAARMRCDIYCRLNAADRLIEQGNLNAAFAILPELEDLMRRGIECGAMVDPWNALGFGGQYSLFPAPENSIHDQRIDDLIDMVGEIFAVHVDLQKEAAAAGKQELQHAVAARLVSLSQWWDKFATTEVSEVPHVSGRETCESAKHVAAALGAWHSAGTAAGDLTFWRDHAEPFRTAKAYALVVEALLDQRDPVASMALLVQWLSQSDDVPLAEETHSFHDLALLWMEDLWEKAESKGTAGAPLTPPQRWDLARKFLDFLEANAEQWQEVPQFELHGEAAAADLAEGDDEADAEPAEGEEEWNSLFGAAYEDVSYRDSADDGFEGETFDSGPPPSDSELVSEGDRLVVRLTFLSTLARLWRLAALASLPQAAAAGRDEALAGWRAQAAQKLQQLYALLDDVYHYRIPPPRGSYESLIDYDRRRSIKESLLEEVIAACLEMADAERMIGAAMHQPSAGTPGDAWEPPVVDVMHAVLEGNAAAVRGQWRTLTDALLREPLLYVSLARGGNPRRVAASRGIQRMLQRLLAYLPKLGLIRETYWLLETVQDMEIDHPVGPGAITEFDQVFEIGCKSIVKCLVDSSTEWQKRTKRSKRQPDSELIRLLEQTVEALLRCWMAHSRGVRLSVLETVGENEQHRWNALKRFVERYGQDLFTQKFMGLGNLRAILHEGVDAWLQALLEDPDREEDYRLLADLGNRLPRDEAERWLALILEAVVENYQHYVDYNTTTTQSDRGEMLYTLLDFLRLLASYDRVAWNLRPIVLAHDVLERCGQTDAAEVWRQAVAQRTAELADEHQKRFARLSRKYGMRLPSIAERVGERFIKPLDIDRVRALVRPAVEELRGGPPGPAFDRLEAAIGEFTQEIVGSGFDLPSWLEALDREIERIQTEALDELESLDPLLRLPQVRLSFAEAKKQVNAIVRDE